MTSHLSPVKREAYERLRAMTKLRTGSSGTGLVLVHPVGGSLLCYRHLLDRLPENLTIIGFSDDKPRPEITIESLARRYQSIVDSLPKRDWVYAGWSFGGAVAYEMSRPHARPVTMIDTDPHGRDSIREPSEATVRTWFAFDIARLNASAHATSADPELADRYQVFAANARALSAYQPGRHGGAVTWVRSARPHGESDAWQAFCPHLTVHEVPQSDHYTLLAAENAGVAARAIIESLT